MIKLIKNILLSPLFVITFIGSIIAIIIYGISYANNTESCSQLYNIEYHEDVNEYDDEIENLNNILSELSPKTEHYDDIKEYYEAEIKIYEELKINNKNYEEIYDFINYNGAESFLYIFNSGATFMIILFINIIVIIYLSFNSDFDNSRFTFIYEKTRYKLVLKKIAVSLLFLTFTFIMLFIIDYLFANRFSSKFNYVLIIDSKAHIIPISSFMITYTSYMFYFMLFVFLLAWSISLIARKTVNTFIGYVILTIIFIILFAFKINIMPYIGLALAFDFVDYNFIYLTRISIIIPIIVLSLSVLKFEKSDL